MVSDSVRISLDLLGVVATLLPLLAVLLQFMVRFYAPGESEHPGQSGLSAIYFVVVAIVSLAVAGYIAGDVIKFATESGRLNEAAEFIQVAFASTVVAVVYVTRDLIRQLGIDISSLFRTEAEADTQSGDEGDTSTRDMPPESDDDNERRNHE